MFHPRPSWSSLGVCLLLAAVSIARSASADMLAESPYTGQLSTESPVGLKTGGAEWGQGITLVWTVDGNTPGLWHYHYELSVVGAPASAIRLFTLETSATFDPDPGADLRNLSGGGDWQYGTFSPGASRPGMPDSLHGLNFTGDGNAYTIWVIDFDSPRAPLWGDFYAQGATGSDSNYNWACNKGFTSPDTDPDPDEGYPIQSGSVLYHVLVPDTWTFGAPEPGTVALVGLGGAALAFRARRRRRGR
jgi:hypothetical protein